MSLRASDQGMGLAHSAATSREAEAGVGHGAAIQEARGGVKIGNAAPMGKSVIWMAYYSDRSAIVLFETEMEALRHAVEHSMQVKKLTLPTGNLIDHFK